MMMIISINIIANIIDLLISLKSSFNKEHDGSRSWAEISDSIKKK